MKLSVTTFIFVFVFFLSCKEENKEPLKEKNREGTVANSKQQKDSHKKRIDDQAANQMMDLFGIKNKGGGFNELFKIDSLERATKEMLSLKGFKALLKKGNYTDREIESLFKAVQQKDSLDAQLLIAKKQGTTKEEIEAMMEEHKQILKSLSNDPQMVEELYGLLSANSINNQLETIGKKPLDKRKAFVRTKLQLKEASFLEEKLSTFSIYNENKRKETIQSLKRASKQESDAIIATYFNISEKELEMAKEFPDSSKLFLESDAKKAANYKLSAQIENHLASGKASAGFKKMVREFSDASKRKYGAFLKRAANERKKFFSKNPSWHHQDNAIGETYRDSKNNFIFLPLGKLSFADKLVSHYRGKKGYGANSNGALGVPDMSGNNSANANSKICNLGTKGVLTLAFKDNTLTNINGPDLFVFEIGAIEPTKLEISKDGEHWIEIGKIEGGTAFVDIEPFVKKGDTFNYIRLRDLEYASDVPGADVDAVAAIGGALRLNLDSEVLFETGKYELKKEGIVAIRKLAAQIKSFTRGTITIEGHTDDVGSTTFNKILSKRRAHSVAIQLKKMINSKDFSWNEVGYGESKPIVPNINDKNRKQNRRVELLVFPAQ